MRDPARLIFVVGTAGILSLGLVGLPLAIAGLFVPLTVIPATIVVWAPLSVFGWRITRPRREPGTLYSVAAVLLVLGFGIFAGLHSSQHLLTDRDPGVYFITALWLAEHGSLLYDTGLTDELVEELDDEQSTTAGGIYPGPDGTSYFQFQHLPALSLAASHWMGGDGFMFRSIATIASVALLGIFLVARTLVGYRLALIPLALAIVHPAFLHFAKDAYSEWFAMIFAFAAFLVWLEAGRLGAKRSYLAVGVLLGAGTMTRIDAWWTATGFMAGLLYTIVASRDREPAGDRIKFLIGGLIAVASLGTLDLLLRSPEYLNDLGSVAIPLLLAFATIAVALLVASHRAPGRSARLETARRLSPRVLATVLVVAGLFGLYLRPHLDGVRADADNLRVTSLQNAEGLALEGSRTYEEWSLEWLARYQGYVPVTFAILATGLAVHVMLRRRGDVRVPVLAAYVAVASLYLWRPSITPDHMWAMRRFLPLLLPLAFIFATWAGKVLLRRCSDNRYMGPTLLVVLGAALTQSVIIGSPIAGVRTQVGMIETTEDLCASLPIDSVVLLDEQLGITWSAAIRTRCDVPVTRLEEPGIVGDVADAGFVPVGVTVETVCGVDLGEIDRSYEFPERTLTLIPDEADRGAMTSHLTLVSSDNLRAIATIPDMATHALQVEVATDWTPVSGSSVVASIGPYLEGMWLEYRPNGTAELWIASAEGPGVIPFIGPINDGIARSIGGYVVDDVLYAVCGDHVVEEQRLTGSPHFADEELRVGEVPGTEAANMAFEGEVHVLQTRP